jgi:hypothetical protein
MRFRPVEPPRSFGVGRRGGQIEHVADIALEPDEIVTFHTDSGTEYDVARKSWGYYATPSLNERAREKGLRAALCVGVPRSLEGGPERMYLMLVEAGFEEDFGEYARAEEIRVVAWLDDHESVARAARALSIEFGSS